MSNGNGPQNQVEPGRPAEPAKSDATFAHIPDEDPNEPTKPDDGTFKSQPSITVICPSCRQPAVQAGKEIYCESCDVIFSITVKKGAQVKEVGPLESLGFRVEKVENVLGITGLGSDVPTEREATARKEGAAEVAAEVAAEIESETPAVPVEPARPASQDGVHADEDEILGPRGGQG